MTTGQFIVVQAGDDISVPDRVAKLVRRWKSQKTAVDLVCSYLEEIDLDGRSTGFINKEVMFVPDVSKDPSNGDAEPPVHALRIAENCMKNMVR